ncbi:hypothetical protein [Cellulomonas sp. ES6]|uniref:hypothetical protein n=1 Tax=Cellulomonas sp. ES6 TaxID=3039384 RepID=UPI0024B7D0E2|nr:hypothetical protein [Cellulomonas sp. ES6]WHP19290.1 hypothetical protein P9841_09465 [Cellulomonas sp. ES6]
MTERGPSTPNGESAAHDPRTQSPGTGAGKRAAIWGAIVLGLGLLVLYGWAEQADPKEDAWRAVLRWVDSFVQSPGLGGLAAVVAASVALGQWRRQERAELKIRRDQQWWDVFKLIYPSSHIHSGPPTAEERQLVDTLADQADTEVQTAAAEALIGDLERRDRGAERGHRWKRREG